MLGIHNEALHRLLRPAYTPAELARIRGFLASRGTLRLVRKENGLYPAVPPGAPSAAHYGAVWVRDTIMVVSHLRDTGQHAGADATMRTLRAYFQRHLARFDRIVEGRADPSDPMVRPHIRFDGDTLDELPVSWSHAQNDALGYSLWASFPPGLPVACDEGFVAVTCRFPAYFEAIAYERDADSGHWEEERKVESSSIGAVVAGLSRMEAFLRSNPDARAAFARPQYPVTVERLQGLIERGRAALDAMLPDESPPGRGADAALLFLIHPLRVVTRAQADAILANVLGHLERDHGILRYAGDSYWCGGYKELLSLEARTADVSFGQAERDKLLVPGTEAEWTIFDPVVSMIHGERYLASRRPEDLAAQVRHLNRSLAQVTADDFTVDGVPCGGLCPEAYYVPDPATGVRAPNDHVPLAWTQANLTSALAAMERSVTA